MLIELTVYWFPDNYDPDEYKDMGKEPEITKGILVINTNHTAAYSPHKTGDTMIRLSNGDVFQSTYPFEKFNELMVGLELAKNMLVSGEN